MDELFLAGRIFFAALFVISAVGHLTKPMRPLYVAHAKSRGLPMAALGVTVSGLAIGAGGLMIAFGVFGDLGAILIAAFLLPAMLTIQTFWKEKPGMPRAEVQAHFMKDMSMFGAALIIFWIFNQEQDLPFTLTDSLIGRF